MEINLKLRSEILEYSLNIEKEINNLLLLFLGIYTDYKSTRLFGNKPNISFKNKIDLLFDLQILSKEENYNFELLMNFRNKFLHDIECNSFSQVLTQFDNGIRNKFKTYFIGDESIDNETDCLNAFQRLFLKNLKVLQSKIETKRKLIDSKLGLLSVQNEQMLCQIDFFFDLINDLYLSLEKVNMEDEKVKKLTDEVFKVCQKNVKRYSTDAKFLSLKKKREELLSNPEFQKEFWNIANLDTLNEKIRVFNDRKN